MKSPAFFSYRYIAWGRRFFTIDVYPWGGTTCIERIALWVLKICSIQYKKEMNRKVTHLIDKARIKQNCEICTIKQLK